LGYYVIVPKTLHYRRFFGDGRTYIANIFQIHTPQLKVSTDLRAGQGGGYVNGVYYPDKSSVCGLAIPPAGGGEIQYLDMSGSCG